jgi:hypothetical protein
VRRRVAHKSFTAATVVAMVVRDVHRVLKCEWARTVNGTVLLSSTEQSSTVSRAAWVSRFKEAWCHGGGSWLWCNGER